MSLPAPTPDDVFAAREIAAMACRLVQTLEDENVQLRQELSRLRDGRLTPEEFHSLCHHLHEQGCPVTEEQHRQACDHFRAGLYHQGPT
jgi:putative ribosome biogenesis GTPase RsgA